MKRTNWKKTVAMAMLAASGCLGAVANAALAVGAVAPSFTTESALAGRKQTFDMAAALKQGPVVLYFFPKAFTQGCTVEAHAFA